MKNIYNLDMVSKANNTKFDANLYNLYYKIIIITVFIINYYKLGVLTLVWYFVCFYGFELLSWRWLLGQHQHPVDQKGLAIVLVACSQCLRYVIHSSSQL